MASTLPRRRIILMGVAGLVASAGVAVYYGFFRGDGKLPVPPDEPTCRIRFLTHEERLHPGREWRHPFDSHEAELPFPPEEVENPALFYSRFVRVRFENTTGRVLSLYGPAKPDPAGSQATLDEQRQRLRAQLDEFGNMSEKVKQYQLSLFEPGMALHPATSCFLVAFEVFGADGRLIQPVERDQMIQSLVFTDVVFPSAAEYQAGGYLANDLQTGEAVELRINSVFGKLTHDQIKPGTYTVRATMSYAEAPSGETKRVTSEPVTVTVTAEHLKAADAHWKALQATRN
jgi:hypothetical protein